MRATNQALGRVIRHINDYGAVFLCDERFEYGYVNQEISSWIKKGLKTNIDYISIFKGCRDFFNGKDPKKQKKLI